MDLSRLLIHASSDVALCQPPQPPNTGPEFIPPPTQTSTLSQPSSQPPTVASLSNTPPLPPPGQSTRSTLAISSVLTFSAPTTSILKPTFVDTGGATSFASRNPLKDIQPPRVRVRNSKSDAVKLGQAARIAARSQKSEELKNGVDAILKSRDREIKDLSEQLDVSERTIQKLVNGETHYKKHREPNMFNALVHKATDEMNTDLDPGDRHALKDIQATVKHGMDNDTYTEAYKNDALQTLKESREIRTMGSRSSNTSAYADARAMATSLTDEFVGLGMRTGVTGLALLVKGHIHDDFADTIVEVKGSSTFFLDVFNMHPTDVCSRFQQWVCNQKSNPDAPDNLQTTQTECAVLIKKGLRMITNIPNLGMNYVNYKISIVHKYHVQLVGWPSDIPFVNPHQLTTIAAAKSLQTSLTVSTCKWVIMSKRQQKDHAVTLVADAEGGQEVGRKRKVRSDKGKKRGKQADEDIVNGDASGEEANDNGDENEQPTRAKKQKLSASRKTAGKTKASAAKKSKRASVAKNLPPTAPKSTEFIDTEDDSDN